MKDQQGWKAAKQELAFVDKLTEEENQFLEDNVAEVSYGRGSIFTVWTATARECCSSKVAGCVSICCPVMGGKLPCTAWALEKSA